uniref:Uncharacterized protein n=1 Tax=Rhizophora mucronata TaxID=61149 RepID=A0A2P2Q100_RHIMU
MPQVKFRMQEVPTVIFQSHFIVLLHSFFP